MYERLLILATCRSEDITQTSKGQPNRLSEYLRLIRRAANFKEVILSGLNLVNVSLLAERMMGGSIQFSFARKLEDESQGNPLFIVESLRMLSERLSLVNDNHGWSIIGEKIGLPTKIKDIILLRVAKLDVEQRELLDIASVIGTKFDPDLIAKVLAKDRDKVIQALNAINKANMLVICEGTLYRFDHAKSRDAVYDELSVDQKKLYHNQIGEKIESASQPYLQVSDLAYHYSQAENKEKAIKYSLEAGQQALSFLLGAEAIKQFKHVLDIITDSAKMPERDIALEGLGDGYFIAANAEAINIFQRLSDEAQSPIVKVRSLRKAARASLLQGNYGLALEIVTKSLDFTEVDKLEGARFLLMKGMVEAWGGYMPNALNDLQSALNVFEAEYSLPDVIDALLEISIAYMEKSPESNSRLGQPKNAVSSILRALSLCEYTKDISRQFYGSVVGFVICTECGLDSLAKDILKVNTQIMQTLGDSRSKDSSEPWNRWVSSYMIEISASKKFFANYSIEQVPPLMDLRGNPIAHDLESAIEEGKKGIRLAEEGEFFEIQGLLYGNLTRQYALLGQMNQAEVYYKKLEKVFTETTLSGFILARILYLYSKALCRAFQFQWEEANCYFDESINSYSNIRPGTGIESIVRQWYSFALLQQGKQEEAAKQLEESAAMKSALQKSFLDINMLVNILVPSKIELNKQFELKLDIINSAASSITILEIADLLPPSFEVSSVKPPINYRGPSKVEPIQISPFQVKSFVFTVKPTTPRVFRLNPKVIYRDSLGQENELLLQQKQVTVDVTFPQIPTTLTKHTGAQHTPESKPFDVFLCYKKSSGKDFADHLKVGLEELGLHTFQDSKDIPMITGNEERWDQIRDNALLESSVFILLMTPGFELSTEVVKELNMARRAGDKRFVFFRIRSMGRKFSIKLDNEVFETGKQEQVSFENKEELLRLAHSILFK